LDRVLNDPRVQRALARPWRLDLQHDLPYLGGYSMDGHTIYIDRHLPASILVSDRLTHIRAPIITHERTEKALMDALGWGYPEAHEFATANEHFRVRTAGVSQAAYESALAEYVKAAAHERITLPPVDLDLAPYMQEHDYRLLQHLKEAISSQRVRQPSTSPPTPQAAIQEYA